MGIQEGFDIKRAESLAQRLLRHPHLRSRLEALLDVVENAEGDVLKADQAEEKIIEELRRIGQQALQEWAERKASRLTSENDKRKDLSRKEKKSLLAYPIRQSRSRGADLSTKPRLFSCAAIYHLSLRDPARLLSGRAKSYD